MTPAESPLFPLLVRQSSPEVSESKFWMGVSDIELNFHGRAHKSTTNMHDAFGILSSTPASGVLLDFWVDHGCTLSSIRLRWDWLGTLGQLVKKYVTAVVVFPFLVCLWVFRTQLAAYRSGNGYPTVPVALRNLVMTDFWKLALGCTVLSWFWHGAVDSTDGGTHDWLLVPLFLAWGVGTIAVASVFVWSIVHLLAAMYSITADVRQRWNPNSR